MDIPLANPWLQLPDVPPFVVPEDAPIISRLSERLRGRYALRLDLCPQPWTGSVKAAEVIVLALNPGYNSQDHADLSDPDYAEQWRLALSFGTRTPFYLLDPAFHGSGGHLWWERRLRNLIDVVGIKAVSRKVMCVEHFPYKSTSYRPLGEVLPSQRYSFTIVDEAIRQCKQIVIMRSERIWLESVPELRTYPYIRLSNHQNPYFSRRQITVEQFDRLCDALRKEDK